MLHSSVVSTQVEYAKFVQSSVETTIASALLACSDPLETVTMSLTPSSTAELTLKVKLRGPDGTAQVTIKVKLVGPDGVLWLRDRDHRSDYANAHRAG